MRVKISKLIPDDALNHMRTVLDYNAGFKGRRTGQTTAELLGYISDAMLNPDVKQFVPTREEGYKYIIAMLESLISKLELEHIKVHRENGKVFVVYEIFKQVDIPVKRGDKSYRLNIETLR